MSKDNNIPLRQLFLGIQDQMSAALRANRENIKHPGAKGDATELYWLEMLRSYLPKRYQAKKAFVLDCKGHISEQIDIVIFDRQYSPLLLNENAIYVPAESVYAVIEVKQSLNKENLEYAGSKAQSVRKLFRTKAPIYHAGGVVSKPKDPFRIHAGLVTLDSDWSPPFGESYLKTIQELDLEQRIDLGCCLENGAFQISYLSSDVELVTSRKETALISFFLNLLDSLQKLGTVPAIDMEKYAKSLTN